MKNIKKLLTITVVMTLMACGNGRNNSGTNGYDNSSTSTSDRDNPNGTMSNRTDNTSTNQMDNNSTNSGTTNDRMDNTSTTGNNTSDRMNSDTEYGSESDRTRMKNLYGHLELSDDQVKQYEQMSRQNMDKWRRSNPNSTLSAQQRMQLEDQSMKGFLDNTQYSSYQQWVRDNPYKY